MKVKVKRNRQKNRKNLKKNRNQSGRRGLSYWMAMGTLMACTTIGGSKARPVEAHGSGGAWGRGAIYAVVQTQAPAIRFEIQAGPLETVLTTYQNLTRIKVLSPNESIRKIGSPGVSGVYTPEQALKQLLTGTGITYHFASAETVTLEVEGIKASVSVMGQLAPLSSPKYTEPLRDVPQTINVIPRSVIEEQGATTLRDVLRNVPGLTVVAGEGGTPAGDNLTLRGFNARNDIFVDGVRDLGPQTRDPFNLEQVEVVKGPGSSFTGRGSAGGTINLVTKSPTINRRMSGTFALGTDRTKRVSTDVNLPFKDRYAFRLNLLGHDSGVADRDVVKNQRWGVAPSLAMGLGTPTRITFSYYHLQQRNISDYGIPWVTADHNVLVAYRNQPAPVPRDTFYGFKDRDLEKMGSDIGTITFERDLDDNVTLRNQIRYGRSTRDSIATPPRFPALATNLTVNRELRSWITEDRILDNQTDLKSRFSTGSVLHSFVTGLAVTHESQRRQNRTGGNSPTTLLNPNPNDVYTGVIDLSPNIGHATANSVSLYAVDTIKLSKQWEFNGSLRYDYFDAEGITATNRGIAQVPIGRIDRMFSGRAGLVFKPRQEGSIYAAYGTSVNPSLEGLLYQPASNSIDPEKTYTVEVGSKWDLLGERLSLNGALFQVEKTNARTPDPIDTTVTVLQGRLRVSGLELGASGSLTRTWKVLAGYTLLDSRIEKSNTLAEVGRRFQNTPRNSFNIWTTYVLRSKLTLGGGPRFVGRRFGNNLNTRQVGSYWTLDALASYPVTKNIDLRLNLYNLNDAYYFDRLGGGHLVPGAGRSVMVSTSFRF
ncbi:MAG TPA: TonB-dependent siderophore receptor [Blastocatellia bacterium]|nr:TonB-dependent siderophore receptor [Blastocatellia bacterium]